nr:ribonuclease H-like domain-containing protein [Tanacetum cinerariifolium]
MTGPRHVSGFTTRADMCMREGHAYLGICVIDWIGWVRLPSICVVIRIDGYAYPGTDTPYIPYGYGALVFRTRKSATEILKRVHMVGCNSSRTPVDTESKPGDDGDPVFDPTLYKSLAVQHQRTKHIEIDIQFVRDLIAAGQVRVLHVPFRCQYAYIFTKGLPSALFEEFRFRLSAWCPSTPTAGEC